MPIEERLAPADAPADVMFAVPDITDVEVSEVVRVLTSGWITTGRECLVLEEELRAFLGADDVIAVASCTAGIEILAASLGLAPGSRIAVPDWTFASTAIAPMHHGLVPVLIDVDPTTLCVSAEAMAAAVAEGIDAAIVVQFAGQRVAADVYDVLAAADVPVIEDAAHALGTVDHRGLVRGAGVVGAAFSFYATKNLTSAEGGAIATERPEVAEFARSFRQHGMSSEAWKRYRTGGPTGYELEHLGIKANLPDLLAALARAQLQRFPEMQGRRRAISRRYRDRLADIDGVTVVPSDEDPGSADHLFVVLLPPGRDRAAVQASMAAAHIGTSVHFRPLHRFPLLAVRSATGPAGVSVAESLADRALSLPMHPRLSDDDVERVVFALRAALAEQASS